MNNHVYHALFRVMRRNQKDNRLFFLAIGFRLIEKLMDIAPLMIFYVWLQHSWKIAKTSSPKDTMENTAILEWLFQNSLVGFASLLFMVFVLQLTITWFGHKWSFLSSYKIMGNYRTRLLEQVHALPLETLQQYGTGRLSDMLTDDVKKVENLFTHLAIELLTCIALPILLISTLVWVDWSMALVFIAGVPIGLVIMSMTKASLIHVSQQRQDAQRQLSSRLIEFIMGIKTLRLLNRSDHFLVQLKQQFDRIIVTTVKVEFWGAAPVVSFRVMAEMGLAALLMLSAWQLNHDSANPLNTVLFIILAYQIISPLMDMTQYVNIMRYTNQSENKLQSLLEQPTLAEPCRPLSPRHHDLVFDHVSFAYQNFPAVLNEISFTAPAGKFTAIVGPSGSGKTTIMNMISRFHVPNSGTINIGQYDLNQIGSEGIYQLISMVFQEAQLFSGTIMENVQIGRPDATEEEIKQACEKAHCHGFISTLPNGYDTYVGENGMTLSGGERQRLSIARAFLKQSPILLLDEMTSSVDVITQHAIQESLNELIKDTTVIMIAHRLNTIKSADQILVVEKGRIVQRGTHNTLYQQEGLYRTMWEAQTTQDS